MQKTHIERIDYYHLLPQGTQRGACAARFYGVRLCRVQGLQPQLENVSSGGCTEGSSKAKALILPSHFWFLMALDQQASKGISKSTASFTLA